MLAACEPAGRLPESGFVTRYVMGLRVDDVFAGPGAYGTAPHRYNDAVCHDLALTRASDAQAIQSAELDPVDRKKIIDLTYDDCVKWRDK